MSTGSAHLSVAGQEVDVVYKAIKNLHISVYPPVGRVRVAAPERMPVDAIRVAIAQRLPWIQQQRQAFLNANRQSERRMLSGESHYVWGQRYLLDVSRTSARHRVQLDGKTLWLVSDEGASSEKRMALLERWYRRELKAAVIPLLEIWEPRIGVHIDKVIVRRMKTKWGTFIPRSNAIWLNLELAKKPPQCLEYIIVHELVHGHEKSHGDRFVALMDKHLPNWRALRDELNQSPLAHELW